MSVYILVDDFTGDVEEFYGLVVEEINRRGLPDLKYDWEREVEKHNLFFSRGAEARALRVQWKKQWKNVLAYQFGTSFLVVTRFTWSVDPQKAGFLHHAMTSAFSEIVDRAARSALRRHLEAKNAAVPAGMEPENVFFQAAEAA